MPVKKAMRRMRGGGYSATGGACPPGIFCVSNEAILFLLVVIIAAAAFFVWAYRSEPVSQIMSMSHQQQLPQSPPTIINVKGGDDRYSMAPKPERVWYNGPDYDLPRAPIPIGMATRGLPEAYQVMGVLKGEDGKMQPLYGRRTAGSSDRYNYYTRTDTYNPVPMPLHYKRRDCQDDVGCDEVMDGDELRVGPTGEKVKATLYKMSSYFM